MNGHDVKSKVSCRCWMGVCLSVAAGILGHTAEAAGADNARREMALVVVNRMYTRSAVDEMIDRIVDSRTSADPRLLRAQIVVSQFLRDVVQWETIEQRLVEIYSEEFTETELRAIDAFFASPTGKKYLLTAPEVSRRMTRYIVELLDTQRDALRSRLDTE